MLVVIGCGNLNRCDDGVGAIVARRLLASGFEPSPRIRIFDAGTNGMDVLFQARGAKKLVIVDACSSGSEPGAIFEAPGAALENRPEPSFTLHDFRWDHALYAGRRIWANDFPEDVTVFLIEAQTLGLGLELSDPVARAAENVTERISGMIEAYLATEPAP
ncbi:hydrogenase maturation protease [Methylocapsa polymorpha]|uniref:Hydrogenase maturation protease n=1 Tax=Methylocapsa polymorpha TaxID=3080828 RepID=A0ABZ0HV70_9HYPH|nr:hydrogenase maturation protease [Methylocapsa sp. RX1]